MLVKVIQAKDGTAQIELADGSILSPDDLDKKMAELQNALQTWGIIYQQVRAMLDEPKAETGEKRPGERSRVKEIPFADNG